MSRDLIAWRPRQHSPDRRRRRRHVHRRDPAARRTARATIRKLLSTPPNYDAAVVEAVAGLADEPGEVGGVVHGTTVATNAVLERRGALTALVTTAGFRDVLELRRLRIPHMYDPFWRKPEPLVPRRLPLRGQRARDRRRHGAAAARPGRGARGRGAARAPTASSRSRSACCTRTASRRTRSSSARSCARSCRAWRSRCRARSCASSASTSARRRRSSTRTCGR